MERTSHPEHPGTIDANQVETPQVAIDLQTLHLAENYRHWLYSQIKPALGRRILEIGSGIGNCTEFLLAHGEVWATDKEDAYLAILRNRFRFTDNLTIGTLILDQWDQATHDRVSSFRPDSVVCLNVLEHVPNDAESVQAMLDCVDIGGRLLLILPALPALYSNLDAKYGHYRRYTTTDASRLIADRPNAEVEFQRYFNFVGAWGWWFNHVLLKREHLPATQTKFFDKLVPTISLIERLLPPPFGLSLVLSIRRIA